MQTIQVITIAVPVSDDFSFDGLLDQLSHQAKESIPRATLYGWIKNVCKLRSSRIYADSYCLDDLEWLLQWLAFRRQFKRGRAVKEFHQYINNLVEAQNHETESRTA
jgi:hypothetical protein